MDKFQNKYRISSARLQHWDYRMAGAYFITICTKNRQHYFGEIENGKMRLSNIGVLANTLWHEIPNHHNNVESDEFVVMPNHVHGILILTGNDNDDNDDVDVVVDAVEKNVDVVVDAVEKNVDVVGDCRDVACNVSTVFPPPRNKNEQMAYISPKSGSISTIIRS